MIPKVKDKRSDDVYVSFLEHFSQDKADEIFELLNVKNEDMVDCCRNKTVGGKPMPSLIVKARWKLACDIYGAFIWNTPHMLNDKSIHPSIQKRSLLSLSKAAGKFRDTISSRICIFRERHGASIYDRTIAEDSLLNKLRGGSNKSPHKNPDNVRKDGESLYEFDRRISKLFDELEWLISCADLAEQNLKSDKKAPKKHNSYEWSFFINLCNIFYEWTEEPPKSTHNYNNYTETRVYCGKVLDFLELCYSGFNFSCSRATFHGRLKDINSGASLPDTPYWKPEWLDC